MKRDTKIVNELGLHARAAARIATLAQNTNATIWLVKDGEKADAASIIDILTLSCPKGSAISLVGEDEGDIQILDEIVTLIEDGFGE